MKQFSLSDFLIVISLIGVCCALFATDGCKAQKLRSAAEAEAKSRRAKIDEEVGQLSEPEWAGEYYYGLGNALSMMGASPVRGAPIERIAHKRENKSISGGSDRRGVKVPDFVRRYPGI